jgi:hypothetical protein
MSSPNTPSQKKLISNLYKKDSIIITNKVSESVQEEKNLIKKLNEQDKINKIYDKLQLINSTVIKINFIKKYLKKKR